MVLFKIYIFETAKNKKIFIQKKNFLRPKKISPLRKLISLVGKKNSLYS